MKKEIGKKYHWTPTGYATHLPSGNKTFSRKKTRKPSRFLKSNIPFLSQNAING